MNKLELYEKFVKETDQDIEEFHDHKYGDWLENLIIKQQEQLLIQRVSQQRELLIAFADFLFDDRDDNHKEVDFYLKNKY